MTLDIAGYTARISNASQVQLCVITYEILLECVDFALEHETADQQYLSAVEKARRALQALMSSLDTSNEIARQLFPLYIYADRLLVQAYFAANLQSLREARGILRPLMLAYREAEAADVPENTRQAVMKPGQQLYAGLTYTGGKLDEYVDRDIHRGFRA
ncbi:MAG: flagellar protein FliS [Defluviitaleaceae bacterium]|nr:flagellar protein FliS [Defluviitaleaceae bacterium]